MPEGDTVLVTATRLHRALAGRRLLATDFRVPAFATSDLSGATVERVDARGKHLLMRTDQGIAIHSHLKMEGEWQVHAPGDPWRGPGERGPGGAEDPATAWPSACGSAWSSC